MGQGNRKGAKRKIKGSKHVSGGGGEGAEKECESECNTEEDTRRTESTDKQEVWRDVAKEPGLRYTVYGEIVTIKETKPSRNRSISKRGSLDRQSGLITGPQGGI